MSTIAETSASASLETASSELSCSECSAVEYPDCPICLEPMSDSDLAIPLECPKQCGYNFCGACISHLIASSKDGYTEASDGSKMVKIQLICPNCRSDLKNTIEETLHQRKSFDADKYKSRNDSELTASQLRVKYTFSNSNSNQTATSNNSKNSSNNSLFTAAQSQEVTRKSRKEEEAKLIQEMTRIDTTLFSGLEFAMTEEEQEFVTTLMTSGSEDKLAQAATILSSVMDMSRKGITPSMRSSNPTQTTTTRSPNRTNNNSTAATKALRSGYSNAGMPSSSSSSTPSDRAIKMSLSTTEKRTLKLQSKIDTHRKKHPLPLRMPVHHTFSTLHGIDPKSRKFPMCFTNDEWDGSIADAFSKVQFSTFTSKVNRTPHIPKSSNVKSPYELIAMPSNGSGIRHHPPSSRVLISTARLPAARRGIQPGDVVTHFNGERFVGNDVDLMEMLTDVCLKKEQDFSFVLNAELSTAEALRLRSHVKI
mmetsp:Transcript_18903/g.27669  ORF Transcript_18903/g.27669 Transcript_18903/m.27669 type:complete len:480 (+) Transcript_18903:144-1583(+)|eukprot:CAMPEP_0195528788 /NCGR_PEP_ID=MMETSP0794_2-20130614/31092_1 /TAXON_ID=515487 /ORGANISM="Stephanopyxis turris, Strain CCMP 815" /LENGTH=479 /DNA_ID=CAMNT_0040659977 /DNA_START=125 /DNA_END=1564 /DNA_ORIENTATION=-